MSLGIHDLKTMGCMKTRGIMEDEGGIVNTRVQRGICQGKFNGLG